MQAQIEEHRPMRSRMASLRVPRELRGFGAVIRTLAGVPPARLTLALRSARGALPVAPVEVSLVSAIELLEARLEPCPLLVRNQLLESVGSTPARLRNRPPRSPSQAW